MSHQKSVDVFLFIRPPKRQNATRLLHLTTMAASLAATGAFSVRLLGRTSTRPRRITTCRAVEEPASVSTISAPDGFVAPTPRKFTVAEGSLGRVVSSAIPLVLRAGTGALINGWSPSLVDDDGEGYSIVRVAGKKLAEASDLGPRCLLYTSPSPRD